MKKHLLLSIMLAATTISSHAQTAISATGVAPDASAMFDVSATDKGMLIPRVALTSTAASAPITSPLTSLLVYNTAAVSDVTPGYYYWNGTSWTRLLNGATNLSGSGTTNYLARWTPNGSTLGIGVTYDNGTNVGIGTTVPGWKLDVAGNARIGDNASQNTLGALAVSAGQGSATTYRDIDLHGSWAANEGHAITASHATGASNIVGQIVFEHNSPGSRIKFGRLYHSGDQTTYPMELVSNGANAILRMNNDAYDYFGPNSSWGAYLQVGGNGRVTTGASVAATNGNLHIDAANGGFATYINYYSANNTYINGAGANVGIGNTSGSARLHVSGGGQILGTNGTSSNTRTLTILEDGDAQTNFGSYPGAWTSALQIQSNDPARYVWLSPISSGGNARLVSIGSDFEILPGNALASTFYSSGDVTTARYHNAQYFNSSDNSVGSGVTGVMVKAGDNYFRTGTAAGVATFLGTSLAGNYIQNQYGGAQSANFHISGEAKIGGWFRNTANLQGLYNEAVGAHFYASGANVWNMGGGGTYPQLIFRDNHQSTIRGYVYSDGSGFGLLHSSGGWAIRTTPSVTEAYNTFYAGTSYQSYIYDRDNSGYYLDPNGSSYTNYFGRNYGWNWTEYDWNNTAYYMDLNNTSNVYILYRYYGYNGPEYDGNNGGYYIDPNGSSRMENIYSSYELDYGTMYSAYSGGHHYIGWNQPYYYCNAGYYSCGWWNYSSCYSSCVSTTYYHYLSVNGVAYSYGWYNYSDGKMKENVGTVDNALAMVTKMRGVTYDWKAPGESNGQAVAEISAKATYTPFEDIKAPSMRSQVGFIAQEIKEVLPQAVLETEDKDSTGKVIGTHLNVNYDIVVPVLVEAIKDLKKELDELKLSMGINPTPVQQTTNTPPTGANAMTPGKVNNNKMSVPDAVKLLEDNLKYMTKEHQEQMKDFINEIKASDKLTPEQAGKVLEFRNNIQEFQKNK